MKLNRRSFLGLIGLAPAAVVAAKLPALPVPVVEVEPAYLAYGWKKIFSYVGDGSVERIIPHELGFKPQMLLIKKTDGWHTYDNAKAYLKSMKEYLK